MLEVAEEEGDAEYLAAHAQRPEDAEVKESFEVYWRAWHALRFDRQYGAFGGETPISFVALDAYARRYGITDIQFETFIALLGAMDNEYLLHVGRKRAEEKEAEEDRRRREQQ